ncbi:MAG: TrkH family potassium uptake protein [Acidimicrobiia bacterium]
MVRRAELQILHPGRLVAIAFASVITIGTVLLSLPLATSSGARPPVLTALFTATSATCVTGLIIVDTPTYWSGFGQTVIAALIQLGGFGIMTFASILAVAASRRIGLRFRMATQAETGTLELGDVRRILFGVTVFTLLFEGMLAVVLTGRLWLSYDESFGRALGDGVFHSISAFNNAGFALFSDSLEGFVTDAWITLSVAVAVIVGGIGFPVLLELRRSPFRPSTWSMHAKLTVGTTAVLIVVGAAAFLAFEWSNPETLQGLDNDGKALGTIFQSVTPRTAGFNTIDFSEMRESTWLVTGVLMFIGGGSASTAGGIKVTTFALLGFVIWSELRGEPDVNVFGRRAAGASQRQALGIALLGVGVVVISTLILLVITPFPMSQVLFEAISAFSVVGLSTGITGELTSTGHVLIIVMMFLGRIGPATLGAALVLRERDRLYRYPEERPIIG